MMTTRELYTNSLAFTWSKKKAEKTDTSCRSECFVTPSSRISNREYPKILRNILLSLANMYGIRDVRVMG
jgi:hypothetical protein